MSAGRAAPQTVPFALPNFDIRGGYPGLHQAGPKNSTDDFEDMIDAFWGECALPFEFLL